MANITAVVLDSLGLWNQTEPMDGCLGLYAFSGFWIQRFLHLLGSGLRAHDETLFGKAMSYG